MLNETDLSRTDLNLLLLFETVFRTRHVGRAAEALSLSPSAISHGLGRLLHDPLFLKHPKGMVPTERAEALAGPIAEILRLARRVVADAEPFHPARSERRFTLGITDGIATLMLPPLFAAIGRAAPRVDLRVRHIMPAGTVAALDLRQVDVGVVPAGEALPARLVARSLYLEEFGLAMRAGHPLAAAPTLEAYCAAQHLVVSPEADSRTLVDTLLERQGLARRVALTVPNFLLGLAVLGETDLVAAMPLRQLRLHGARFGVMTAPLPVELGRFDVQAVIPRVGAADAGLAWLLDVIASSWEQRAEAPPAQARAGGTRLSRTVRLRGR